LGRDTSTRRIIGTLVFAGLFLVLSMLVVPALTDWHIPEFAFWVFVAILFAIPGGIVERRRRRERPYEAQLEELQEAASSPEPAPRRSE
jgi:Flp pilus assembly protein TadB